jgi:hypothetical protein
MSTFSIYDIFNEAEDADNPSQEEQEPKTAAQAAEAADDDDFDIDTSLDDNDGGDGENEADDNNGGGDDLSIPTDGGAGASSEDEPVESNTELFDSLSAEEQMMKISELKHQYADLFNSCDDMIDKLSTIKSTELTMVAISRLTNMLMNLKSYITDYLYNQFASNSYYENDVYFNRFLAIFKSISNILNDISRYNIQN